MSSELIKQIADAVEEGMSKKTKALVTQALEEGVTPDVIMNDGLINTMGVVGKKFSENLIFVPEMLVSAKAMAKGLEVLEPHLVASGVKSTGTVVIGTVKKDMHDIGKNLVVMMMRGIGATVYDLGVDVKDELFLEKALEVNADIICLSSLLTTTMAAMGDVIKVFENAGVRDKFKFMVGGAPVNAAYAKKIGADYFADNAGGAAEIATQIFNGNVDSKWELS